MSTRLFAAFLVLFLLIIALWAAGLWRAERENARWISQHVMAAARPRVIDLRPTVYRDLPAPVYAWTGAFRRFGLPLIESRDAFDGTGHDMQAKLLGWLKVMHTDYADPEQVASLHSYLLLRYHAQAPMMPWAMLPNAQVKWVANDDTSAYLEITRPGLAGHYLVRYGDDGHIASMESDRLLMEGNGTMPREIGLKLDYRVVNGFKTPTRMDYRRLANDGQLISHYAFRASSLRHLHEDHSELQRP